LFLRSGVDPNGRILSHGETALMMAARTGILDTVKKLLEYGADVHAKEDLRGTDALMWAAEQGHSEVVQFLIDHGAGVNSQSKVVRPVRGNGLSFDVWNADGRDPIGGLTALLFASREGSMETVRVLVAAGADVNAAAADGSSPLMVAIQNGQYAIAQF